MGEVPETCEGSFVTKAMCNSLKATDKMIKLANAKGGGAKRSEGRVKVATPVDLKAANKLGEERWGEFQGRLKTTTGEKKEKKKVFCGVKKGAHAMDGPGPLMR